MSGNIQRDLLIRQGLKLTHLRLMAALAETGQISGAAAQLAISQPAASRLLSELEQIVDVKLYQRHPRGVVLSDFGLRLAERARKMLQDLDDTGREIAEMTAGLRGVANIGAVTGPSLEMVLPAVRRARLTHPEIDISITVDTSDGLADGLLSGRLDFYIGRVPRNVDVRPFHLRVIGEETISLIVRDGHPLVQRPPASIADCIGYDWVLQMPGGLLRHTAETYLLERGHALPGRVVSTSSLLMTLALISQSNAIAVVARSAAEFFGGPAELAGRIRKLPVAEDMKVSAYSLITLRDQPLSAAARVLHNMIETRLDPPVDAGRKNSG